MLINDIKILSKEDVEKKLKTFLEDDKILTDNQININKEKIIVEVFPKINNYIKTFIEHSLNKDLLDFYGFKSRSERDQKVINYLILRGFGKYIKSIFENFPIGDKFKEHLSGQAYLEHNIKEARKYSGIYSDLVINLEDEINSISDRILRGKIDEYLNKISVLENWADIKYLLGCIAYKIKISKKEMENRILLLKESDIKNKHFFSAIEIFNLNVPDTEFYINNLIPKKSLIIIQGKPNQFKSFFALALCVALKSKNTLFIDRFDVNEDPKIIYYDLEYEISEIKKRISYCLRGINAQAEDILNNFQFEKFFKRLNKNEEIEKCKNFDLIILDSYRRFLDGDENRSENINKFYIEFLKPLLDLGKTIIIIAHEKKGSYENYDYEGGRMEMLRGSGDISAQADLCLALTKNGESKKLDTNIKVIDLNLSVEKNRKGLELEEFNFHAIKDDENKKTTLKFTREGKPPKPKEKTINHIIEFVESKKNVKRTEIIQYITKITNYNDSSVDRILKEMLDKNLLTQSSYGLYSYTNSQQIL